MMVNIKVETRKLVNHGSHYTMKLYQCEEGEEEVSSKMNFKNYINKWKFTNAFDANLKKFYGLSVQKA